MQKLDDLNRSILTILLDQLRSLRAQWLESPASTFEREMLDERIRAQRRRILEFLAECAEHRDTTRRWKAAAAAEA